jgi:thiosulfate/3-mercaptopyruvate sulfurtransferase
LPLVPAEALLRRLHLPDLRIVDVRWSLADPDHGRREYEAGHIPGAIHLSVDRDLSAPPGPGRHPLPSPIEFATEIGRIGIGDHHQVVVYDDAGGGHAARLWWMLRAMGHEAVGILDGGWPAWQQIGGPAERDVPTYPGATHTAPPIWPGTIDRTDLENSLGAVTIVDVRAGERFRGEVEPVDPVAGHIPTARNIPATDLVGPDGRLVPAADLADRFAGLDGDVVVYCGSGVVAGHAVFAMHLAGSDATLYPGSWSDWCTSGGPVATGPEPEAGEP